MLVYGQLEMAGAEIVDGPLSSETGFPGRMVMIGDQVYFWVGTWVAFTFPTMGPLTEGQILSNDGVTAIWQDQYPSFLGKEHQILRVNGTEDDVFWDTQYPPGGVVGQILRNSAPDLVEWGDQYPDMTGHTNHILRSDGVDQVFWSAQYPPLDPGKFLTNDGAQVFWDDVPGLLPVPVPVVDDGKYLRNDDVLGVTWEFVVRTDLNAGSADYVLINDAAGLMSEEQFLAQVRGGFGQDVTAFGPGLIHYDDVLDLFTSSPVAISDVPDLSRALSTGVISGGVLSINADPTLFDLSAGTGEIIDYTVPTAPTQIPVTWGASTGVAVTNLGTAPITYVLIDNLGAIVQQTTFPTPSQQRDFIYVGRLNHSSFTAINYADSNGNNAQSIGNQYADLLDALGPFNIEGNTPSTNGPNLTLSRSAGIMFARYFNRTTFPKNPHGIPVAGQTPLSFSYRTQQGGSTGPVTAIDPTRFDDGSGTPALINPVPASNATIQRIFLFPSGETRIQYGQNVYPNLATALDSLASEAFVVAPSIKGFGILIGYVVVQRNASDLTESDRARVIPAARFDIGVGGGGSIASTTLQQAYQNGFIPHITLTQTGGGLTIRDAATPLTPVGTGLFRVQNNAGTVDYLNVSTDGIRITPRATAPTPPVEGTMWYDTTDHTIRFYSNRPDSINVGQEVNVLVRNITGSPLVSGQVVRITGAVAGVPTVALAQANSFATSRTFAVITESIANNTNGFATICGRINQMTQLGTFADGDYLFLSPTVAGGLTNIRPSAPNYAESIGSVVSNHPTQGILSVDFGSFRRIGYGAINQLRGMNATAAPNTEEEYKTLLGTASRVTITHGAGSIQWDIGSDVVTLLGTQTLQNKTLVSPIIDDGEVYLHETTVATPLAGRTALFAKSDNRFYIKDSTGLETPVGTGAGSGGVNVVTFPTTATGWFSSAAPAAATTTVAAEVPLSPTVTSAIKLTRTAAASYDAWRWQMPVGLFNQIIPISWYQIHETGALAGGWKIDVYTYPDGTYTDAAKTRKALRSDVAAVTSVPLGNGFMGAGNIVSFDSAAEVFYEMRITRVSDNKFLSITNVNIGPGSLSVAPAVSGDNAYVPTFGAGVTATVVYANWTRVVSWMEISMRLAFTNTGVANRFSVSIPPGHTIDPARASFIVAGTDRAGKVAGVGYGTLWDFSGATEPTGNAEVMVGCQSDNTLVFISDNATIHSQILSIRGDNIGNGDTLTFTARIPIAEWVGQSPMFVGPGNAVQFAADDGTADVFGPNGAPIPTGIVAGPGLTTRSFSFPTVNSNTDSFELEILVTGMSQTTWIPSNSRFPFLRTANNDYYGMALEITTAGIFNVYFGNKGAEVNASIGANGQDWSAVSRFRLRKSFPGIPAGIAKADSNSAGLVAPRKGQYDLTPVGRVTSSLGTWVTVRGVAIYYQDQDGNHRLKFNIVGTSATGTANTLTVSGVTFKNINGYSQTVSTRCLGTPPYLGSASCTFNTPNIAIDAATTSIDWRVSGDVELESKPSWA